jgi:hypothetical protein
MLSRGKVYACGHSKGGNLAVFAAVNCSNSLKRKIEGIYAFDAPGFPAWFFDRYDYGQIRDKIELFNPQSSIIGRALVMEKEPNIVFSEAKRTRQHSVATWVIEDKRFRRVEKYDEESDKLAAYLNALVDEVGEEDLGAFYNALEATAARLGISNFYDIKMADTNLMTIFMDSIRTLEPAQRERLRGIALRIAGDIAKDYVAGAKSKAGTVIKNVTHIIPLGGKKKATDLSEAND